MYLIISTSDKDGQYLPSFALEVDSFHVHGFTDGGMWVDLRHKDGDKERVFVGGESRAFSPMSWQAQERVQTITLTSGFPPSTVLTKDQFHARVGKGGTLNSAGHFEGLLKPAPSKQAVLNDAVFKLLNEGPSKAGYNALGNAFRDVMGFHPWDGDTRPTRLASDLTSRVYDALDDYGTFTVDEKSEIMEVLESA